MKKFFTLLFSFLIVFSTSTNAATIKPPSVSADGAIILDADSGNIIYGKNIDKPFPPASTTKIMTALLTLENCKLQDIVTVGKNPPEADGSKIYIFEGEKLTVDQLIHGLLLASANDCAEALAEHMGGSIEGFAKMMNKRAKELGCKNTNFVNPSGLYNDKHRSSARDLALIMRELVKHPEYSKIAKTISYKIPPTNVCKEERPLWNENKLVQPYSKFYYNYCEGGKTGYTVQSFHSYVSSASKNNHRLIVALTHDKEKTFFKDSVELFKYGFENFNLIKPYVKGQVIENYIIEKDLKMPLVVNNDFYCTVEKGKTSNSKFKIQPNIDKNIKKLTVKKGETIGTGDVIFDGKNVGQVTLLCGKNYEPKKTFISIITNKNKLKFTYIIYVIILIIIIRIIYVIIKRIRKNKKLKKYNL